MEKCAVGPCLEKREAGRSFCAFHGPKEDLDQVSRAEIKARRKELGRRSPRVAPQPPPSAEIVCPHCQARGGVRTRRVKAKKGVSGGKATAAILTSGLSLLAVGLSRQETITEASCSLCESVWIF